MAAYLNSSKKLYNRYYGGFRGVDFASDHTDVDDSRLAFAVNMYRDYSSGEGESLETIPGFRRIIDTGEKIYGIHEYTYKADGETVHKLLVHAGNSMYDVNEEAGTKTAITITSGQTTIHMNKAKSTSFYFNNLLYIIDGANYLVYDGTTLKDATYENTYVPTTYKSIIPGGANADTGKEYEQRNLLSPYFKNTFIGDGHVETEPGGPVWKGTDKYYLSEQGLYESVGDQYFWKEIDPNDFWGGSRGHSVVYNVPGQTPMNQEEPIGAGKVAINTVDNKVWIVDTGAIVVKVYGTEYCRIWSVELAKQKGDGYYYFDSKNGIVTFGEAPSAPRTVHIDGSDTLFYPDGYDGIEITVQKKIKKVSGITETELDDAKSIIQGCTLATIFDDRVFLSGNPKYPNHVFHCGRNNTNLVDPTYFGILNNFQNGVTNAKVTGMVPVSDTLMILKEDTNQEGSIFYRKPRVTDFDVLPVKYDGINGASGVGCVGACIDFIDDPVFLSTKGLEAVGMLSTSYERSVYHRSSLVDPMLTKADLKRAVMEIWNGYLCILVDGKLFLADSRQVFSHKGTGAKQYEWYYIEGLGVWKNQYLAYVYDKNPGFPEGMSVTYNENEYTLIYNEEKAGQLANEPQSDDYIAQGMPTQNVYYDNSVVIDDIQYTVSFTIENGKAIYCVPRGDQIGGTLFNKAVCLKTIGDDLYFGTENGVLCKFNFDKRTEYGDIPTEYYNFDGRTIFCCAATKMDNCGIPGLTKSTQKKSTVIKTRSMNRSAAKIKIRTNRKPYTQIARINSSRFAFDNLDFSDFSFNTMEQSLFAVKEKEKKWVEKQYFIYSDEFCKPFSLHYITYRYFVAGKYKNK